MRSTELLSQKSLLTESKAKSVDTRGNISTTEPVLLLRIRMRIEQYEPAFPVHCGSRVNRAVISRDGHAAAQPD